MSQNRQVPPGFGGGPGRREEAAAAGGSVRRARELLEAGVRRELPAQSPYGNNAQSPGSIGLQPRGKPPTGSNNTVPMAQQGKPAPSNSSTPRGPPPLRPRRPGDAPSPLQNEPAVPTQARQPLPTSDERDSYVSPTAMVGKDYRSEALTDISENIPAPPVATNQAPTAPPRRNANLAPPPSSRRGPSSYYSRGPGPFVSPIAEESSDNSPKKDSYASSAVIPLSWGSGPPESDVLGNYDDETTPDSDSDSGSDSDDDSRRSDASNDDQEPTLVRQASLGKRGKPALRTINNKSQPEQSNHRVTEETGLALTENQGSAGATRRDSGDGGLRYPSTVDLDSRASTISSNSSDSSGFYLEKPPVVSGNSPPKAPEQVDRNVSGTERNVGGLATPAPGMSDKVPESRRPPRLNVDAVREAETRGSLTSLTDLIKRATMLASNLERGRTASRLGFLDMLNGGRESNVRSPGKDRGSGSISDILASFPPPRNDTPNTEKTFWPYGPPEKSKARDLQSREATTRSQTSTPSNARRRCCGMPLPAFIFLSIVALLLVAAAVILPVVLVVIPRHNHTVSANSSNVTDTNQCQQSLPCMNGGVSVMNNNNTCACVCVNGFSGRQCTISDDASCTTTEVGDGSSVDRNATVGSALPRLFSESQFSFNIPLNEAEILSLFSANNVSCTTQNALVSFNGLSEKRRRGLSSDSDSSDSTSVEDAGSEQAQTTSAPTAAVFLGARDDGNPVATSNGILFEPTATSTPSPSSSASSATVTALMLMGGPMQTGTTSSASSSQSTTSSASSSSSSPSSSSSSSSLTTRVLDFARIAVLFIFQQTDDLLAATTAQSNIASFLTDMPQSNSTDMNMSMNPAGSGANTPTDFVLNFANFTITLANGTVVGGGRGSTG